MIDLDSSEENDDNENVTIQKEAERTLKLKDLCQIFSLIDEAAEVNKYQSNFSHKN